jgi:hypothetical protein
MRITGNILLIALGAIMKFAVRVDAKSFDIHTVGVILMVVGAVALGISLSFLLRQSRIGAAASPWPLSSSRGDITEERRVVYHDGPTTHYDGPQVPYDPDPY